MTGSFNEGKGRPYTAEDMRFTAKDGRLYVIALGWPAEGILRIKSLARDSRYLPSEITKVEMLGMEGALEFQHTADALLVSMPAQKPNGIAYASAYRSKPSGVTHLNSKMLAISDPSVLGERRRDRMSISNAFEPYCSDANEFSQ